MASTSDSYGLVFERPKKFTHRLNRSVSSPMRYDLRYKLQERRFVLTRKFSQVRILHSAPFHGQLFRKAIIWTMRWWRRMGRLGNRRKLEPHLQRIYGNLDRTWRIVGLVKDL